MNRQASGSLSSCRIAARAIGALVLLLTVSVGVVGCGAQQFSDMHHVSHAATSGGDAGGLDLTPPSTPSNLAWYASGMTVVLGWSPSTDDVGVTGYLLFYGNFPLGLFTDTTLSLIGFKSGTPYLFTVKAVDAAGNVSQASNQITVIVGPDPYDPPPAPPTNLQATSVGSTFVSLKWVPSYEDPDVVVYQVYADGRLVGTVPAATSAKVTGLMPGTTYSFTVTSIDAAGNVSMASSAVVVTTTGGDTTPPTAPTNLTAAGVTSTWVDLSWSASSDDTGVTSYDVYVGSALAVSSSGTRVTVYGLLPVTTYSLTVKARDAAGNSSPASAALFVTTHGTEPDDCMSNACFRVDSSGRITKNGQPFPFHCASWTGLQGRYELASDAINPRGAPMELYVGNPSWPNDGQGTGRTVAGDAKEMVAAGINVIRIPVVHQTLDYTNPQGKAPYLKNHASVRVANSRLALELLIKTAAQNGLSVVLDLHSCSNYVDWRKGRLDARPPWVDANRQSYDQKREDCSCAADRNPSTVTRIQAYNETVWLQDLQTLAGLSQSLGVDNVIGIDVFNEPWDYSWQEWKTLVERAYAAIDSVNPNLLLFVQGVGASHGNQTGISGTEGRSSYGAAVTSPSWGENLYEAEVNPPSVPKSRLVYAPHAFGPSVALQPQFIDPSQPECAGLQGDAAAAARCNLVINPTRLKYGWEEHFGYLKQLGYAVVVGAWGGNLDWPRGKASLRDQQLWNYLPTQSPGVDEQWQSAFAGYLAAKGIDSCYWSINPESEDTGGWYDSPYDPIVNRAGWGEWTSLNSRKTALIQKAWGMSPPACTTDVSAVVGRACDAANPCPCGTVCGSCGIATGQCVVACDTVGPPSVSGCPQGTFCSRAGSEAYWGGSYGSHFCVRTCDDDADCHGPTGNEEISCNGAYADDGSDPGVNICNVSNSFGSSHACQ